MTKVTTLPTEKKDAQWSFIHKCNEARDLIRSLHASNNANDPDAVRAVANSLDLHIKEISQTLESA